MSMMRPFQIPKLLAGVVQYEVATRRGRKLMLKRSFSLKTGKACF